MAILVLWKTKVTKEWSWCPLVFHMAFCLIHVLGVLGVSVVNRELNSHLAGGSG